MRTALELVVVVAVVCIACGVNGGGEARINGVSFGGWLVMETSWMYDQFHYAADNDFVQALVRQHNVSFALATMKNHWFGYLPDEALDALASFGITHVRIPVGYWTFDAPAAGAGDPPATMYDYGLNHEGFATGGVNALEAMLSKLHQRNMSVLLDLHAPPGVGSKCQSYSGEQIDNVRKSFWMGSPEPSVQACGSTHAYNSTRSPHTPWLQIGLSTIEAMARWVVAMNAHPAHANIISHIELVNEPGLGWDGLQDTVNAYTKIAATRVRSILGGTIGGDSNVARQQRGEAEASHGTRHRSKGSSQGESERGKRAAGRQGGVADGSTIDIGGADGSGVGCRGHRSRGGAAASKVTVTVNYIGPNEHNTGEFLARLVRDGNVGPLVVDYHFYYNWNGPTSMDRLLQEVCSVTTPAQSNWAQYAQHNLSVVIGEWSLASNLNAPQFSNITNTTVVTFLRAFWANQASLYHSLPGVAGQFYWTARMGSGWDPRPTPEHPSGRQVHGTSYDTSLPSFPFTVWNLLEMIRAGIAVPIHHLNITGVCQCTQCHHAMPHARDQQPPA